MTRLTDVELGHITGGRLRRGKLGFDILIGGGNSEAVVGQDGNDLLLVNNGDGSDFC